jgi:hypothetical protein
VFSILAPLLLAAQTGFVPPVLKGVKGDVAARTVTGPIAFPAADEEWSLVRSPHFVFISSAGERRTREIAGELETLAAALSSLTPQFRVSTEAPTRVFLFARPNESRGYFDMLLDRRDAHVSGVFVSQKAGGSMLMNASTARDDRTPFHELVHDLINNSDARPPLWLEEGLAEYFGNAEARGGKLYVGERLRKHALVLQQRTLMPLDELFAIRRESDAYNVGEGQAMFYAESWATVDWLVRNGGKDQAAFYAFLRDVEQNVPVETALQNRYGRSLHSLETSLRAYVMHRLDGSIVFPVPAVAVTTEATALDRAGILYELGHFLAGIEEMKSEAERHFRAALAANPKHARALAGLGRFEEAIAADPNDAEVALDYAESLMDEQIGPLAETGGTSDADVANFRKARALAQRAIDLGDTSGRALGDLGTSSIVEPAADLAPGIAALERAHALLPARTDYALHLFAMLRRTGDRSKADPLFAWLAAARSPQVAYAARAVVMRVESARATELVHQQKLDEAAQVLRALAAEGGDGMARADLERQAAEYEKVAATNRQIEAYNAAIGQVNKGQYAAARKSLERLLAGNIDAEVARDAKKLLAELKRR